MSIERTSGLTSAHPVTKPRERELEPRATLRPRSSRTRAGRLILVTGSTGNAGAAVVRALVSAGEEVRALVRSPAKQAAVPHGVEAVRGDLNRPETLRHALDGVRAVFLLSGYDDMPTTLAEIRAAGSRRVVLLSSSAAPAHPRTPPQLTQATTS